MPHLTSDALRQDPAGLEFLRGVLKPTAKRPAADTAAAAIAPLIAEPLRRPALAGSARLARIATSAR